MSNARPAGSPPWTVAIQGVDRGDANDPHDAASKLRERLLGLVRDAEEGRLARARLECVSARLQAAEKAWAGRRFSHASTCLWSFSECSCGLSALAAALKARP